MARPGRPFGRVLIANRGEIAVRILRACRELGVETVAVYSDSDAGASHVRAADLAVRLGPAPSAESYLRGDAIVEAALATASEAIHPGYGFLSERPEFAAAVEAAGLVFIGPTSASIAALGDKLAARRSAAGAGVPVVPGTLEPAAIDRPDGVAAIAAEAERVGYPLLVKAAAGGGGRGMRRVVSESELPSALAAAAAEARSAFGDGTVYLEREIRPARHIEVQLLGDREGTIVAVGERDCSVQRRHQKLVEEAPAPGLTAGERREVHDMAVRAARAAGLENAATAEFLFDRDRRFWFLEVNTRLQVEHGVTELVADIDIVREQLFLATGRPLSDEVRAAAAGAADPRRHAIEIRLSAEDPARAFAPTPGTITRWQMPAGPGVRVDTAIRPGDRVPPDYDPLIAKLLVVDRDRDRALDRLRRALDEVEVAGIQTTLPFHRFIARSELFRDGPPSIDWVDVHWAAALVDDRAEALELARWVAAAAAAAGPARLAAGASPRDGSTHRGGPGAAAGHPDDAGARRSTWAQAGRAAALDRRPR
ncbi:MAG TPA: biotin carboxylase N-terminal domain-containing protein [Candidatus Limnocylindrales bacterium]|nr:biotin carboxylase N-terminal domain-containing protein [Candidatus Limnocylindrales bacterium]